MLDINGAGRDAFPDRPHCIGRIGHVSAALPPRKCHKFRSAAEICRAETYRSRLIAVRMTVTTMNVITPTLPNAVLARMPRGSSSGAV